MKSTVAILYAISFFFPAAAVSSGLSLETGIIAHLMMAAVVVAVSLWPLACYLARAAASCMPTPILPLAR